MPWPSLSLTTEVSVYIGVTSVLCNTVRDACSLQVNSVLVDFVGTCEHPEEPK